MAAVITVRLPPVWLLLPVRIHILPSLQQCLPEMTKDGGANIKVMQMMNDIRENVHDWSDRDEVKSYLGKMLDGQVFDKKGLIYGMGHAVYSLSDPRERVFRSYVEHLAEAKGARKT